MTDLDTIREMLAGANARYSITVAKDVTIITAAGTRDDPPYLGVEFQFTPQGKFIRVCR